MLNRGIRSPSTNKIIRNQSKFSIQYTWSEIPLHVLEKKKKYVFYLPRRMFESIIRNNAYKFYNTCLGHVIYSKHISYF